MKPVVTIALISGAMLLASCSNVNKDAIAALEQDLGRTVKIEGERSVTSSIPLHQGAGKDITVKALCGTISGSNIRFAFIYDTNAKTTVENSDTFADDLSETAQIKQMDDNLNYLNMTRAGAVYESQFHGGVVTLLCDGQRLIDPDAMLRAVEGRPAVVGG